MNGEYRFECANKFINFTMADFNTNKNLGNVLTGRKFNLL